MKKEEQKLGVMDIALKWILFFWETLSKPSKRHNKGNVSRDVTSRYGDYVWVRRKYIEKYGYLSWVSEGKKLYEEANLEALSEKISDYKKQSDSMSEG